MDFFTYHDLCLADPSQRVQAKHDQLLEDCADKLTLPLVEVLNQIIDLPVDFSALVRPHSYLVIYQIAAARHQSISHPAKLQSFSSYKQLAAIKPGDATHALLQGLLKSSDIQQSLQDLFGRNEQHGDSESKLASQQSVQDNLKRRKRIGISFGMSVADRLALQWRTRGRLKFLRAGGDCRGEIDRALRLKLCQLVLEKSNTPVSTQERGALVYAALTLPTFVIEGCSALFDQVVPQARSLCALVMGTEFQRKPAIAMLIAILRHQGKKIIGVQHGGGYGQADPNWWERAERFLCDEYRTWGYQHFPADMPLPSIKLSHQAKRSGPQYKKPTKAKGKSRLLLAIPYLSEEFECALYSPPYGQQLQAVQNSLNILAPALKAGFNLSVRLHPKNAGTPFIEKLDLLDRARVEFATGKRGSIAQDADSYDAVFFSSPQATGISECLACGQSFYVATDPAFFWIRDEARAIYRQLLDARIWLTDSRQLEDLLTKDHWQWNEDQKRVMAEFSKQYAAHSSKYLQDWGKMLNYV